MASVAKICFVATTPFVVNAFLLGHLRALSDRYSVSLCVNRRDYPLSSLIDKRIKVVDIPICRKMSPWQDLRVLLKLAVLFREERFDVVHSITPKGGLLAMLAAALTRVPLRFHTFTGQVWSNRHGLGREFFKQIDRLIVAAASRVFADSQSQCHFMESERVVAPGSIEVLGGGSICGVDPQRFCPNPVIRQELRSVLGGGDDACVFLFVGRLARDKGVFDLLQAFVSLAEQNEHAVLWMVGPDEERLQAELALVAEARNIAIRWVGPTFVPEHFMAAADVLVLPSYREGFGMVIVEAAACGIPSLAYRIDGVTDAVIDGSTGVLVPKGSVSALFEAMRLLLKDPALRARLGRSAYTRVMNGFSAAAVTAAWVDLYNSELGPGRQADSPRFQNDSMLKCPAHGRPVEVFSMKRVFDLLVAVPAAIALALPFCALAVLVRLTSPGPVLYWSNRVGRDNRIFRMPKFRSMRVGTPAMATHLLQDANNYLTPIGSFLRKSSLDELPQLWSILKGDMSFVGPRPALFNQDDLIAMRTAQGVHELVPGLTGWAQINGRDELPIPEKVALDVVYMQQRSFWFDCSILWKTALKVIRRDGVSH